MWDRKYNDELHKKMQAAIAGGGQRRIDKQHAAGKMTARERIYHLFDKGTFVEVGAIRETKTENKSMKTIPGDGVITGYGKINGKIVYVSSQDFTVNGGTLGEAHSLKICQIMDMALDAMCPYISINDSGGARIEAVSYTHLDVYKRQPTNSTSSYCPFFSSSPSSRLPKAPFSVTAAAFCR